STNLISKVQICDSDSGSAKKCDYAVHYLHRHITLKQDPVVVLSDNINHAVRVGGLDAFDLLRDGLGLVFVRAREQDDFGHECFSAFRALEESRGEKSRSCGPLRAFRGFPHWTYSRSPWILAMDCLLSEFRHSAASV